MINKTTDEVFAKYVEESNKLIEKNEEYLKSKGLDTKLLKFKISDDNYENIKNFFRFYILILEEIINDFDSSPLVIKELKKRYNNSKYKVVYKQDRYFVVDDKYVFETDTAHSFKTIFYQFLRDYYSYEFYEYTKYNNNQYSEYDRYIYLLKKIDNNEFNFKEEHKEVIDLFNILAGLYHSINNVVLVPYGYNMKRSEMFNDIYSLSINNLLKLGFDKDMIKTLGCIKDFNYDLDFYNNVKEKTRVNDINRVKLTIDEYKRYLNDAINFIQK